ncbi:hypothetical protein [Paenibacillus kyungheensis]
MVNHMTSIGFNVSNEQEFDEAIQLACTENNRIQVKDGYYFALKDISGSELWVQVNNKNECIGMNPHFSGKSNMYTLLNASVNRPDSILDGALHAWAEPEGMIEQSGLYPFVFDLPNSNLYPDIVLPQLLHIQLAAFTHELNVYQNEEDYFAQQDGEVKFAAQSFIPTGLFGDSEVAQATAMFTGNVLETKRIQNTITGEFFSWSLIETLGGTIDMVTDEQLLLQPIEVGNIVKGSFWLSGTLIGTPELAKKSLFQRLFK